MKRYIRTKDGKIIDLNNIDSNTQLNDKEYYDIRSQKFELVNIVKQADTIEELIEVGDLVKAKYENVYGVLEEGVVEVLSMEHFSKGYINKICMVIEITELYTKQGRNYVLVWTKEEGVI